MRDRKFVSFRYFKNNFTQLPDQIGNHFNQKYNDKQGAIGQFTFFKQNFYKTNYIYGFGTTEDVPTGYNVAITSGWYQQLELSRAYAGIDANFYRFSRKGDFIQYFFRTGGFVNKGKTEDAGVLHGHQRFQPVVHLPQFQNAAIHAAELYKANQPHTLDQLKINNPFGIRYFGSDSALGDRRISLHGETFTFFKYKLFGFQFSPFVFQDVSVLTPEQKRLE